jgi:hypothetical protein
MTGNAEHPRPVLVLAPHRYRPTPDGNCAACGARWEHLNHEADHRRAIRYTPRHVEQLTLNV